MANTVLLLMFSWLPVAYSFLLWGYGFERRAWWLAKYAIVFLVGVNLALVLG